MLIKYSVARILKSSLGNRLVLVGFVTAPSYGQAMLRAQLEYGAAVVLTKV